MEVEEPDFLVALTHTESPDKRLLELNWCAYNIKNKTVSEESNIFINPSGEELEDIFANGDVTNETGVTIEDMQPAEELPSAMQKFNKFIYETIILQNSSFSIISNGDDLLTQLLPDECTRLGLKLAPHFSKYYDIFTEFEKTYPDSGSLSSVNDMLKCLGLIEAFEKIKSHEDCKSIIRIISHMIKDGHKFEVPKDINAEKVKPKIVQPTPKVIKPSKPLLQTVPALSRVILIKGMSPKIKESEIEEFLYGLRIEKIQHVHEPYGEKTGFIIVKMLTDEDTQEALCYDRRKIKNKTITIEETNEELLSLITENAQTITTAEKLYFLKSREKIIPGLSNISNSYTE